MRLYELIQTQLSPSLNDDPTNHRIRINPRSDAEPKLTLRHLNRIKKLRKVFLKQAEQKRKLRGLMYGGAEADERKHEEFEQAQHDLEMLRAQIGNEIDAAEIEQDRKDKLTTTAMRYVKKAGSD